jgi:macrolide transport system ATP-binding/permease protein
MSKRDRELNAEIEHHLQALAAELERQGVAPAEAMRRARIEFGAIEAIKDECREERRGNWLLDLGRDMRQALRMLRRSPVLAAAAVLSLALGIGGNTAIFTLIDCLLLRALPVERPSELFAVKWRSVKNPEDAVVRMMNGSVDKARDGQGGVVGDPFSFRAFEALQRTMQVAGYLGAQPASVNATGVAEAVSVQPVSGNYYGLLGVAAYRGRLIQPEDDRAGAPMVVVASHRFWRNQLAADAGLVGKTIRINNQAFQLIGVTPPEFFGIEVGANPELSLPLRHAAILGGSLNAANAPYTNDTFWWVKVLARVPVAGVSLDAGNATLRGSLAAEPKSAETMPRLWLEPAADSLSEIRKQFSRPLQVLMGMMALVLFIASANVANLLLARAVARDKEILVRLSLGATAGRLTRQFLAEFLVLALVGAVLAVGFAYGLVELLVPLLPGQSAITLTDGDPLQWRVLGFTSLVALLVTLVFGMGPALQAARRSLTAGPSRVRSRLTGGLVVSQVALATVLIVGAGLFATTLRKLHQAELGFEKERLIVFSVDALQSGKTGPQIYPLYRELQRQLAALPGVTMASASQVRPMSGAGWWAVGRAKGAAEPTNFAMHTTLPGYMETLGVKMREGRTLGEADLEVPLGRVVINETLARQLFKDQRAVGQTFHLGWQPTAPLVEVVGVARDARYESVREKMKPTVYMLLPPKGQFDFADVTYTVRTAMEPTAMMGSIRKVAAGLDPNLPLVQFRTMEEQIDDLLRQDRLFAWLCGGFALLALLLAALGLFGVLVYRVNRRTTELGIRQALGAPRWGLWRMVMGEGARWIALGAVLGSMAAWQMTKLIQSSMFGFQANDLRYWVAPMALLLVVAAVAVAVPAWRACRVDPMEALRRD